MKPNRIGKAWLAMLCSIVLVGGGVSLLAPSSASAQASINWKHIWKTQIKPRADKRYYTKLVANNKFARLGSSYTKAESDAKYTPTGTAYTKAESDAKYAPRPNVIRGAYFSQITAAGAGSSMSADISFGWSMGTAPTVHIIPAGGTPPAGCSGTLAAPSADPGNLCVFERLLFNANTLQVCNVSAACGANASPFGAFVVTTTTGAGVAEASGSWAVSPATSVSAAKVRAPSSVHPGPAGR